MSPYSIITENALDAWVDAHQSDAPGVITDLVADLVKLQCPAPQSYRFPRSDSINQPGIDGVLNSPDGCPPYIPSGLSYWEIGVGGDAGTKFTDDYIKRTDKTDEPRRKQATFVFVTPRSATSQHRFSVQTQQYLIQQKSDDNWADIRIIDGTQLCAWVNTCPVLAKQLLKKIAECSSGINFACPKEQWEGVQGYAHPHSLPPELFLVGRDAAIQKVKEFLSPTSDLLTLILQTNYPDHIADFMAAFLEQNSQKIERNNILIVRSEHLQEISEALSTPHFLVLTDYEDINRQKLSLHTKGHRVIRPKQVGGPSADSPDLPMPNPHQMEQILETSNLPYAQSLAHKSNGNIPSLLRLLEKYNDSPHWGKGEHLNILAIMALIGEWEEDNPADLTAVKKITGKQYEEWKKELVALPKQATTPFCYRNGKYSFILRYEGWQIGANTFTQEMLKTFFTEVKQLLTSVAQSPYTIGSLEQTFAVLKEEIAPLPSKHLMQSMAEMLAIISTNTRFWETGSAQWLTGEINTLVQNILSNTSPKAWQNLYTILPLLAEAAPAVFLQALTQNCEKKDFLNGLYSDEKHPLHSTSAMPGILWALECLAWEQQWFPQAVSLLGILAQAPNIPTNRGNTPSASLKEIFCLYFPHTFAADNQKAIHLTCLAQKFPLTAWELILEISPFAESIWRSTYRPRWRELSNIGAQTTEHDTAIVVQRFTTITNQALGVLIQQNEIPLEKLAKGLKRLPKFTDTLLQCFLSTRGTEQQKTAWELLSSELRYIEKNAENYQAIATAVGLLNPEDKCELLKQYFDHDIPDYDNAFPYEEQSTRLEQKREEIIADLFQEKGIQEIIRFASLVAQPGFIGAILAKMDDAIFDTKLIPTYLLFFDNKETKEYFFLKIYLYRRYTQQGDQWLHKIFPTLPQNRQLDFLLCLPCKQAVWTLAENISADFSNDYWKQVVPQQEDNTDRLYPLHKLLAVGRNDAALYWIYFMRAANMNIQVDAAKKVLLDLENRKYLEYKSHYIEKIMDYLHEQVHVCDQEMLTIEYSYTEIFQPDSTNKRFPKCFIKQLLESPVFFVETLKVLYKTRNGKNETENQNSQAHISRVYELFRCFTKTQKYLALTHPAFSAWLTEVLRLAKEYDRYEAACSHIGRMLFHTPADQDGFWIDKRIARIINENNEIGSGYYLEAHNSRGIFSDTQGKAEQAIAQSYKEKATAVRDLQFFAFAHCLDSIATYFSSQSQTAQDTARGNV